MKPILKSLCFLTAAFGLVSIPASADAFCTLHAVGPDTCTVNEGQSDPLTETVVNLLAVPIFVNSITAGPIVGVAGTDPTDWISTDPVSNDNCTGNTLAANGGSCTFVQTFTTGANDNHDPEILAHGESTMFFNLAFTPQGGGPTSVQIASADVTVNDVPEPSGFIPVACSVFAVCCFARKRLSGAR